MKRLALLSLLLTADAMLLAACGSNGSVAGSYRSNCNHIVLDFEPQHQVTLTEQAVVYRGWYSVDGNRVINMLERPYINGMRKQAFRAHGRTLVAVSGPRDLFLPGGTKFEKIQ